MKFFIAICLSLLIYVPAASSFETSASYAILVDYETGQVLFEKAADDAVAPSSMSKLMTVYIVFEKLKKGELLLTSVFNVSENAWRKQGSKMFVHVNSQISIDDLLKGIIIQSGNDACIVIAEGIAGTEEEFANLMNSKAKEIGLTNSHFVNSTGWPDPNHVMSMRDLSILSKKLISDFPQYYHYFSQREYVYNGIKQQNRNMLLDRSIGVDGLKTGHTEAAGYGMAISAKQSNRRLVAAINGLSSTVERATESQNIINYGFLNFVNLKIYHAGEIIDKVPVWMGKHKEVEVYTKDNIWFTMPKAEVGKVKVILNHDTQIVAPILKDQKIAELVIETPGNQSKTFDLLAKNEVGEISFFKKIVRNFTNLFKH